MSTGTDYTSLAATSAVDTATSASKAASSSVTSSAAFDDSLTALLSLDSDKNGLTIGDFAKFKFDKEAAAASGDTTALSDLNFVGSALGTEHPQSFDLQSAQEFIAENDLDGDGTLSAEEVTSIGSSSVTLPFSEADLDVNGDGIIDQKEMKAFSELAKSVLESADENGTVNLGTYSAPASGTSVATGTATETATTAAPTLSVPSTSSSTSTAVTSTASNVTPDSTYLASAQSLVSQFNTDSDTTSLSQSEISAAATQIEATFTALDAAESDGVLGLSAEEVAASTDPLVQEALGTKTSLTAEELYSVQDSLATISALLTETADTNGDGLIDSSELATSLTALLGSATGAASTAGSSTTTGASSSAATDTTTSTETDQSVSEFVSFYDADGDQTLSATEIQDGIAVNDELASLLTTADTNADGAISAAELTANPTLAEFFADSGLTELTEEDVTQFIQLGESDNAILSEADTNGDGQITTAELTALVDASGATATGTAGATSGTTETSTSTTALASSQVPTAESLFAKISGGDNTISIDDLTAYTEELQATGEALEAEGSAADPAHVEAYLTEYQAVSPLLENLTASGKSEYTLSDFTTAWDANASSASDATGSIV